MRLFFVPLFRHWRGSDALLERAFYVYLRETLIHRVGSMSRVEKRRSNGSLPVAIGGAFATPPQSGLT